MSMTGVRLRLDGRILFLSHGLRRETSPTPNRRGRLLSFGYGSGLHVSELVRLKVKHIGWRGV